MEKHTYIFSEGRWESHGSYVDQNQRQYEAFSELQVLHGINQWQLNGFMELAIPNTPRMDSTYIIEPLKPGLDFTLWQSENPSLGLIEGKFMIAGDTIISYYQSKSGLYTGHETLVKLSDGEYTSRGFSFKNDKKLSSWVASLKKISG